MKKVNGFYILFITTMSIILGCKNQNNYINEDTEMIEESNVDQENQIKKDHTDVQIEITDTVQIEQDITE